MASAARIMTLNRSALLRPSTGSVLSLTFRSSYGVRSSLRSQNRRSYSSEAPKPSSSHAAWYWTGGAAAAGAAYYWYATQNKDASVSVLSKGPFKPTREDFQKVYDAIAKKIEEKDEYDDGSYGPVLLRLAWHASGTYDAQTGTGGSNGATMRFAPESDHGANAGLKAARNFLDPIKEQFPWITYSDLWILGGVCAIQEMQGPIIPFRPGRQDRDVSACTPDGRLPDGSKGAEHLRAIFGRMGFDDREIVALSGAHALGRCHPDRSGFDGPWTFSPTVVSNDYFRLLLDEKWHWRKWNGPKQYEDDSSKTLMMLPTDMALVQDKNFRKHVQRYASDDQVWFREFADCIVKLFELGVPFTMSEKERWTFKASWQD